MYHIQCRIEDGDTLFISIHFLLVGVSLGFYLLGYCIEEGRHYFIYFLRGVHLVIRGKLKTILDKTN